MRFYSVMTDKCRIYGYDVTEIGYSQELYSLKMPAYMRTFL